MTREPEHDGSKLGSLLLGIGIGGLIGILFAPRSGQETREYLSEKVGQSKKYAQRQAREIRERADDLLEDAREAVDRQKDSISEAVRLGVETYQRESQ